VRKAFSDSKESSLVARVAPGALCDLFVCDLSGRINLAKYAGSTGQKVYAVGLEKALQPAYTSLMIDVGSDRLFTKMLSAKSDAFTQHVKPVLIQCETQSGR
jgi:hypothetical protein